MAEDVITENENEQEDELLSSEELELLDQTEVREEDAAQFPQELIVESSEEIPAERRENITQMIMRMSVPEKIRLAMLGNREARKMLIHERNKVVATAVLRSPKLTTSEIQHFAQERGTPEDVILTICKRRTWLKNYQIKLALVTNPKTPLPKAVQLLAHLHDKDLQSLTRNKNVPAAISQNAWQMLRKRKR